MSKNHYNHHSPPVNSTKIHACLAWCSQHNTNTPSSPIHQTTKTNSANFCTNFTTKPLKNKSHKKKKCKCEDDHSISEQTLVSRVMTNSKLLFSNQTLRNFFLLPSKQCPSQILTHKLLWLPFSLFSFLFFPVFQKN